MELVKKFGNSSFEREDEEVNIVLIFGWFIKVPKDGISRSQNNRIKFVSICWLYGFVFVFLVISCTSV